MPTGSDGHYMANPQALRAHGHQKHDKVSQGGGHPHSVSIHHAGDGEPHPSNPHHVHIHHADGTHAHSDHGSFEEAIGHAQSQAPGAGSLEETMQGMSAPGEGENDLGGY